MNDQYYPTPPDLARMMWQIFENKKFSRVLEPSAGTGDLLLPEIERDRGYSYRTTVPIDVIESNIEFHPTLNSFNGVSVVGFDFLKFTGSGAIYSHIIMNPPFASGANHVLKAWDIMWSGEIVALVNAETIHNPYSKERQMLVGLIDQYGSVRFVTGAFNTKDTVNKTNVECAIIHLKKEAKISSFINKVVDPLKEENVEIPEFDLNQNAIAISSLKVSNLVKIFRLAVASMEESIKSSLTADHYAEILGKKLNSIDSENNPDVDTNSLSRSFLRMYNEQYAELKDRAWTNVLRSSEVSSRLSSEAQKDLEANFEKSIKPLEFTVENIYGFLIGISDNQGNLQTKMICSVFDLIVMYHTDNTVFYKGWVSNDIHKKIGMQIKKSRFVLPGFENSGGNLDWNQRQKLDDIDKVFGLLSGNPTKITLVSLFENHINSLKNGEKMESDHFSIRYYPGIGTIHFYPKDQKTIDRLNKIVGTERRWLPVNEPGSTKFWAHYNRADKASAAVKKAVVGNKKTWRDPFQPLYYSQKYKEEVSGALDIIESLDAAINAVILPQIGVDNPDDLYNNRLEHKS